MWMDKKVEDMSFEEARQAVTELREMLVELMTSKNHSTEEQTEWKSAYKKPPLGCNPSWLSSSERIGELTRAITRNIESPNKDIDHIRKWATEILYHCAILEHCGWKR